MVQQRHGRSSRRPHCNRRPLHRTLARNRRHTPFLRSLLARSRRRHHYRLPRSALSQRCQPIRIPDLWHPHLRNQRPAGHLALVQRSFSNNLAERYILRRISSRKMAGPRPLARNLHPHLARPDRHRHPLRLPPLRHEPVRHRHLRHPHRPLPRKLISLVTNI